jgi:integrase
VAPALPRRLGPARPRTLGREADGWTRRRAEAELRRRLVAVDGGYRKPEPLSFSAFADRFEREYLPGRNLKASTLTAYEVMLRVHLRPHFGALALSAIEPSTSTATIAAKAARLSPKTVGNHLGLLRVMFKVALRWRLVARNPVLEVERPRIVTAETSVLSQAEIAALWKAYDELAGRAEPAERAWWELARTLTFVALGTALRRGELLALRWRDVGLLDGLLRVREAYVGGQFTTPKSRASRRTIELGTRTLALLQEEWQRSAYRGDDELVFGQPRKGTPLDPSKLGR